MNIRLATLVAAALACGSVHAADLTVRISDIRAAKGMIRIAVVNSEAAWNNGAKPVAARAVAANGAEMSLSFPALSPGAYAVQIMHDENGNDRLDTNVLGIPTEGYGFSNNPRVMRRPHYDEARFDLGPQDATITVHLR